MTRMRGCWSRGIPAAVRDFANHCAFSNIRDAEPFGTGAGQYGSADRCAVSVGVRLDDCKDCRIFARSVAGCLDQQLVVCCQPLLRDLHPTLHSFYGIRRGGVAQIVLEVPPVPHGTPDVIQSHV